MNDPLVVVFEEGDEGDADRYERLRQSWLNERRGGEADLIVRQGLLAWLQARPFREQERPHEPGVALGTAVGTAGGSADLVYALANLILHRRQEVAA